ncbi:hypothetical protein [Candidatus Neptunichlamydia sp. REUL1]|uniref:hypothetical protein n=1 Tax=Candidatus Neptunichlamydia sp. REUL1 TaxID=3064277 RepID=UPI0029318032|nr:hypothetical protein [Candidatus Neptunochlamydia sp. REUL1]
MTVELLRKFVDVSYLRNDFEYGIGKIKKKDEACFEDVRKYHGYRPLPRNDSPYIFKPYLFARVKGTEEWRRATDPRKIGGQLGILTLTNPVVYILTTVKRVAESVIIFARFFFDTFADLYPQKTTDNLAKAFIPCLSANLKKKKREYVELWDAVKNDFHCAVVMELAALHGLLNIEDATRMQFLFGDKERQWNRYKEAEAFKHIEVDETSLYGVSLFFSKYYKTVVPLLWTFIVKESAQRSSLELSEMIHESGAYGEVIDVAALSSELGEKHQKMVAQELATKAVGRELTTGDTEFVQRIFNQLTHFQVEHTRDQAVRELQEILTAAKGTPIEWLGNVADHMSQARIKRRDIELLAEVIDASPKFKAINIRELTASVRLKFLFLMKYFFEIAGTYHSGFIQYQCAYPLSDEKQQRVEVMERTIDNSIEEAWHKFVTHE